MAASLRAPLYACGRGAKERLGRVIYPEVRMAILEAASVVRAAVIEHPTTKAQSGIFSRALATVLVWYGAFVAAQEMATQAQKERPRLGE